MTTTTLQRALLLVLTMVFMTWGVKAAEIRGRILGDAAKPLAHAVVRLLPDGTPAPKSAKAVQVETGPDGAFVAAGLTGESFRVRVEAKGYAPLTQPQIPAGSTLQLRLRGGVKISGIVRDRATRAAIPGATVYAWEKDAEAFGEDAYHKATSGKDGRFVVADLPAGKAIVEGKATGHAPARTGSIAIPKDELELLLDLAGGVTGVVTDSTGAPVSTAEVTATWRNPAGAKTKAAKTGADGHFRIADAVPDAVTRVAVRAPKFLLAEREGPVPSDGVVEFVLEHGGSISGVVRGYDGKMPASFHVKVKEATKSSTGKTKTDGKIKAEHDFTDPGGAFRLDDIEPGRYTIEVAADHYASATKADLDVAAEQVVDAGTLTLQSRSVMRGRVVAARDRTPVAGVTIHITLVEAGQHQDATTDSSWSATSAADGTFSTPTLPAGTFDVALDHSQYAPSRNRIAFQPDADAPEVVLEMYRGGTLGGSVVDAKQQPVPGVRIVATQGTDGDSRIADTGSDGHYVIDGLAPGTWTVTRQQQDRRAASPAVDTKFATIREGETTTIDFDEKPRVLVSGTVMKGDTPIPGAPIYFVSIDNNQAHDGKSTQADGQGAFQIGLLHGGKYQVSVVLGGAATANGHSVVTLNIPDQSEVHQDIVFTVHAITGHVKDGDRNGVKGALVTAVMDGAASGDAPRQSTAMSIDDGVFRIEAVDPGTYRVTARAKAFTSAEEYPVVVADDAREPDLELVLKKGWIMRGRLLDPQGRGVPGALVVVAPAGAAESGYLPSQTDATGAFRITAPADGPTCVGAGSPRFAPAVQCDVEQQADGSNSDVVLNATPGGSMRIRVVHRGGGVVTGVLIAYQPVPLFPGSDVFVERNKPAATDADGSTLVTLLYPGVYMVSILGRRDAAPIQVRVNEGAESAGVIEVP